MYEYKNIGIETQIIKQINTEKKNKIFRYTRYSVTNTYDLIQFYRIVTRKMKDHR